MIDYSKSIDEAEQLFEALAHVQSLLQQRDLETGEPDLVSTNRAIELLEKHTFDTRWRDEVVRHRDSLATNGPNVGSGTDEWANDVRNNLNATLARARDSENKVWSGIVYVQHGMYNDAFLSFTRAPHALLLNSHLRILQQNWTYVVTTLSKQLVSPEKEALSNQTLLNLALAYWYREEFGNCLATLLRLNINEPASLGTEHGSVWLSHRQVRRMLAVCILLYFDSPTLHSFALTEPRVLYFDLVDVIRAFLDMNLPKFWELFEENMEFPTIAFTETPFTSIKDKIHQNWLLVHNKTFTQSLTAAFARPHTKYDEFDLIDDLNRWNAPYKVDLVNHTVNYMATPADTAKVAETLAYEFERDAMLLLWNGNKENAAVSEGL